MFFYGVPGGTNGIPPQPAIHWGRSGGSTAGHNDVINSGQAAILIEGNDNKVQINDITEAPIGIWKVSGTVGNTHSGNSFFDTLIPEQDPVFAHIGQVVPQR
jgi:hypothetical protein